MNLVEVRTTVSINKDELEKARRLLSTIMLWDSLSKMIEDAIDTFDIDSLLISLINDIGLEILFPSSREIISRRPKVKGSSADIVREMRNVRI